MNKECVRLESADAWPKLSIHINLDISEKLLWNGVVDFILYYKTILQKLIKCELLIYAENSLN